jgi:hypothetical protein
VLTKWANMAFIGGGRTNHAMLFNMKWLLHLFDFNFFCSHLIHLFSYLFLFLLLPALFLYIFFISLCLRPYGVRHSLPLFLHYLLFPSVSNKFSSQTVCTVLLEITFRY